MKAILILEDGTTFEGTAIGAEGTVIGEVVFNTAMTGYQQLITDPASYGQIVAMTYPLIGNYGMIDEDGMQREPQIKGFVVRELCDIPNNWRSTGNLNDYLASHGITGIEGIDTRALTRLLRDKGTMNGIISTDIHFNPEQWQKKVQKYRIINPAFQNGLQRPVRDNGGGCRVAMIDLGDTAPIMHALKKRGCSVDRYPYHATAEEILKENPDGIVLSNGAGDPMDCTQTIKIIQALPEDQPVFGIGLGHQVIALALGAKTIRLKYGHRGGNHPVKDVKTGVTHITVQNHGYIVDADSIHPTEAQISHINMNDGSIEGLRYQNRPVQTVQFHPEGLTGTSDTAFFYDEFVEQMGARIKK